MMTIWTAFLMKQQANSKEKKETFIMKDCNFKTNICKRFSKHLEVASYEGSGGTSTQELSRFSFPPAVVSRKLSHWRGSPSEHCRGFCRNSEHPVAIGFNRSQPPLRDGSNQNHDRNLQIRMSFNACQNEHGGTQPLGFFRARLPPCRGLSLRGAKISPNPLTSPPP